MVDEYKVKVKKGAKTYTFRFLYGRWIRLSFDSMTIKLFSSDSSMVDEYDGDGCMMQVQEYVQIPLWSMNTDEVLIVNLPPRQFRFLYGRWIPNSASSIISNHNVQIPLWSMNTLVRAVPSCGLPSFRFLYGRWIHEKQRRIISRCLEFRFLYGRWIR